MSYFVIVVGQRFPVVVSIHLPLMVEIVLVHLERLQAGLLVHACKIFFPTDLRHRLGIKVDPYEAQLVNVNMHFE